MKKEINVPSMGESITQVTIGTILVHSGSHVKSDDPILELETDKVNQQLYSPQEGIVTLNVKMGDIVKIGQQIGFVDSIHAEVPLDTKKTVPQEIKKEESRNEAITKGLRETKEDFIINLQKHDKEPPSFIEKDTRTRPESFSVNTEKTESRRKMSSVRRVIAQRMVEAQHTAAMLTTFNEIDLSQVIQVREKYKESFAKKYGVKLGFMPFFIKASLFALQACKELNSYIEGEDIVHREYYDISVAIGTDKGVMVPVIRNCDRLSFAEIELAIEEYAKKAKNGTLTLNDLQGGGFTITNGGVYGSLLSTPILNPPQSGILGMHKIEKRPVVVDDQIVIRPMMYVALSYDHRIVDGKEAVNFLVNIKNALEDMSRLLINM